MPVSRKTRATSSGAGEVWRAMAHEIATSNPEGSTAMGNFGARRRRLRILRETLMALSGEEIERYARHLVLHEVGGPG